MVRYGILGFGLHGWKRLVPAFAGAKTSELTGIWRRNLDKAKANARDYGIENVFATAEDLCASPDVDAVFVTSPDAFHMRDTLLALAHGKAVLCEKPLAMNAEEVEQMLAAARKANLLFGVAQNFRYNRSVNLIRDWVKAGRIGRPVFASAHFYFQSGQSQRTWIYDPSLARGGPIGDVGIHCLDTLRFVLQDDIAAVTTIAHCDAQSGSVEASAALALDFRQGAIGSVMVSFRSEYRTLVEVVGETGVIRSENCLTVTGPVDVQLLQSGKVLDSRQVTNADAYCRMLDAFSAAIEGHGSYSATGEDGLKNQRALDAAYASWQSGRKEIIP
jgi:1,5-anhydro-D-fructose reductase (1,5-anhydro-D-mannitol-forming)